MRVRHVVMGAVFLSACLQGMGGETLTIKVLSFNILAGGAAVSEIGLTSPLYNHVRYEDIAKVVIETGAHLVAVLEPPGSPDPVLEYLKTHDDPHWQRRGGSDGRINMFLYAKCPIEEDPLHPGDPTIHRVNLSVDHAVVVHLAHWWPANGYGPFVVQDRIIAGTVPADLEQFEQEILAQVGIPATYNGTLAKVQGHLDAGRPVIVLGDFNEASHLDWTAGYATSGADRWVSNTTATPLRFDIAWTGSKTLVDAGMKDAFREIFPNPATHPGNTWTPPYANGTPGRRPYDNQVLDRIDWILYGGTGIAATAAAIVGEKPANPEHAGRSDVAPDIQYTGSWPSDHRAVLGTFMLESGAGTDPVMHFIPRPHSHTFPRVGKVR